MGLIRIGRVFGPGRQQLTAGAVALLAACSVLGIFPSAVQASAGGSVPTWTRQHAAIHPPARSGAAMAYDAATGTAVLFGGTTFGHNLGDTWTWNGSTWTKQAPSARPPGLGGASMAYDAATGTAVLFGGFTEFPVRYHSVTWTWDGSTWTKQSPAASPPARAYASMVYDAATGTAVLFGGYSPSGAFLGDTWTWDGSTWTKQSPAASPPARGGAAMAYDAATGTAVLFGGWAGGESYLGDTWTWDGTTWTQQAPAASPPGRYVASMAYDAATGTAVLFGGFSSASCHQTSGFCSDTWTWDGSAWTQQHPATHPHARQAAAMAYDAATGTAVLFGGENTIPGIGPNDLADTWTWR
jgi:hypothetical protein